MPWAGPARREPSAPSCGRGMQTASLTTASSAPAAGSPVAARGGGPGACATRVFGSRPTAASRGSPGCVGLADDESLGLGAQALAGLGVGALPARLHALALLPHPAGL